MEASFDILLADGERRLKAVDAALDEVASRYRGRSEDRSYKQFIEALRLANNAARARLASIRDNPGSSPEASYGSLHSLLGPFPAKHEKLVRALQVDRAEELEVFAQPFTRLAKSLLPNVEVLFFSWAREAHEITIYDTERAKDLTPGAAVSLRREFGEDIQFLQLWHPTLREPALFQHAVFGHELGHPAIRQPPPEEVRRTLGRPAKELTYASIAIDTALEEAALEEVDFSADNKTKLLRWFDEIACDQIGMRLFGPAFAIAYVETTSVNRHFEQVRPEDFTHYPPPRLRFFFLRRELGKYSLGSREQRLRPILDRLVSAPLQPGDAEKEVPGSTTVLKRAVELFSEHCIPDLLRREILDPDQLREELEGIWAALDMDIPPAERILVADSKLPEDEKELSTWSVEYDWRSILNGVALWLLDWIEGAEPPERAKARETAVRVATGAIEMAEFQRRARILRAEFRVMAGASTP